MMFSACPKQRTPDAHVHASNCSQQLRHDINFTQQFAFDEFDYYATKISFVKREREKRPLNWRDMETVTFKSTVIIILCKQCRKLNQLRFI